MIDTVPHDRRQPSAAPFRVALAVSLIVHAMAFWEISPQLRPPFEQPLPELDVRLVPLPGPPPEPQALPAPRARPRPAPPVPRRRPTPKPVEPAAPAPPVVRAPASPPAPSDFLSDVQARRSAREQKAAAEPESAPPAVPENDRNRANRAAASNLASGNALVFGYDPTKSGGVFQIERLTADYAEFTFTGWNSEARRRTKQLIEVRKGDHGDIRLAIVRRMIAIIRQHEPVEFVWHSDRLGRSLTLSSRLRDNAGLEEFMMQEFFPAARR